MVYSMDKGKLLPDLPIVVWKYILKLLDFAEKKNARLVCKQWSQGVCDLLRDKVVSLVRFNFDYSSFYQHRFSIQEFLDLQQAVSSQNQATLLHNIGVDLRSENGDLVLEATMRDHPQLLDKVFQLYLYSDSTKASRICQDILIQRAAHITVLDIIFCSRRTLLTPLEELSFPELKFLAISLEPSPKEDGKIRAFWLQFKTFLDGIKGQSPKLCGLKVTDEDTSEENPHVEISYLTLELGWLQHLDIEGRLAPFFLDQVIRQAQPPSLESLVVGHLPERISPVFLQVLQRSPDSLRYLYLDTGDGNKAIKIKSTTITNDFPELPALQFLGFGPGYEFRLLSKCMLKKAPNLKELKVVDLQLRSISHSHKLKAYPSLERISCERIVDHGDVKTDTVAAVAKKFPGLRCWNILDDPRNNFFFRLNHNLPRKKRVVVEEMGLVISIGHGLQMTFPLPMKGLRAVEFLSDYPWTESKVTDMTSELMKEPLLPDLKQVTFRVESSFQHYRDWPRGTANYVFKRQLGSG